VGVRSFVRLVGHSSIDNIADFERIFLKSCHIAAMLPYRRLYVNCLSTKSEVRELRLSSKALQMLHQNRFKL